MADAAASPHSPHQIIERKGEEMREGEERRELVIGRERKGKNFAALAAVAPSLSSEVSCCNSRMRMNNYRRGRLYLQREHPDCGEDGKCMVGWRRLSRSLITAEGVCC